MVQTATGQRAKRADAKRNYDTIVAAARNAVAQRGGDIVLEDIAREAGVGIGTLYRHFPTRQALLEATFLHEALELRDRALELADSPSAFAALVEWLRLQMALGARGRTLGASVMSAKYTEGSDLHSALMEGRAAGTALLRRAEAEGAVRPGLDLTDVLKLIHGIVLANEPSPDPARADRMFELVVAGLRP